MQALPMVIQAGGSLIQGIAGYRAGRAGKRAGEANAVNALNEGAAEAGDISDSAREAMGEQIGSLAGNGFEIGTGSALTRLEESAIAAEMDIQNARRKARGRAIAYREQGRNAAAEGTSRLLGGFFGAAGAIANHRRDYAAAQSEFGFTGKKG